MARKLPLTLACGDYEIVRALKEGSVEPDGIEVAFVGEPHQFCGLVLVPGTKLMELVVELFVSLR